MKRGRPQMDGQICWAFTPVNQRSNGKSTMNEDVSPIKNGGFPASHVSLPKGMYTMVKVHGDHRTP